MMQMTDQELIHRLKSKVARERELAIEILELLQKVHDRQIHLKMGYGSFLKFCVEELKYGESTAYRRIAALRLSQSLPSIKQQLKSGEINFQKVSQVQNFLNQEKKYNQKVYSHEQKQELIQSTIGKSSKQVEVLLAKMSPSLPAPEQSMQINGNQRVVNVENSTCGVMEPAVL
jgi:hypothetical protein